MEGRVNDMYEKIRETLEILKGRSYDTDLKKVLRNMEMADFIFTMMNLDGRSISKEEVQAILRGETIKCGRLEDHIVLRRYMELYFSMCEMLTFETDIELSVIGKIYGLSSGLEIQPVRQENLTLYTFDYTAPKYEEVMDRLKLMLSRLYSAELGDNLLMKAAYLHNELIAISPYKHGNEVLARALLYYYLMSWNFPVFELRVREQDYNIAVMEYLKAGDLDKFYKMLERNVYNKLSAMLTMTEEEYSE